MNQKRKLLTTLVSTATTASLSVMASAQTWSMVIMPDTQNYTRNSPTGGNYMAPFTSQVDWVIDQKETRNIQYVLHEGDLVHNNNSVQWSRAKSEISRLDGVVPYALATGNHDYGPAGNASNRSTLFNNYFSINDNSLTSPSGGATIGGVFEVGKLDNSYHIFSAPDGRDMLIISLEWGPRDEVVSWANTVAQNHPDHTAVLLTHAYMYNDETRYDWATKGSSQSWNPHSYGTASLPGGTNDGQELWDNLVGENDNFAMTFNGHVLGDGIGTLQSIGSGGQTVTQMLFNSQFEGDAGDGWLRLVEFDGENVNISTYSPHLDLWRTDDANQFSFQIQSIPEPSSSLLLGLGVFSLILHRNK